MKCFKNLFSLSLLIGSLGYANECCEYSCGNSYVTADYLLWKAHVDQLEYAIDGLNFPTSSGETRELDWQWHSGYKVGIGYAFSNGWDIYLNYTRFHTKATGSAFPEPGRLLYATYSNPFLFDINFASSEFELSYNTIDMEVAKTFFLSPFILFCPNFGFRIVWANDQDDIFYDGFLSDENIHLEESFRGIGPRIGFSTAWNFCRSFSLFGEGEYALIWGKNSSSFYSNSNSFVAAATGQEYYTLRNLIDVRVGLGWEYCFCPARKLELQLAWEQRLWLEYNQYFRFVENFSLNYLPNSSNLSLYGLTLGARYSF